MPAYYNENDPFAASWLRELIKLKAIADGEVDERDIQDVRPSDLDGFTQCHFFAGIGGWSYALRLAGWPDDLPVWTGSCPCQPFSTAGKRGGVSDERHLWPSWFYLIEKRRPVTVFGEQVEAAIRQHWLDLVSDDMEGIGYTVGAVSFPACSVGAPHQRQRLYFVGDSASALQCWERSSKDRMARSEAVQQSNRETNADDIAGSKSFGSVGQSNSAGSQSGWQTRETLGQRRPAISASGFGELANPSNLRREQRRTTEAAEIQRHSAEREGQHPEPEHSRELSGRSEGLRGVSDVDNTAMQGLAKRSGREISDGNSCGEFERSSNDSFWRAAEFIPCRDGKSRPVEPGTFPLAHGVPNRVGRLRGYGNAIVAPQAAAFVQAFLDSEISEGE